MRNKKWLLLIIICVLLVVMSGCVSPYDPSSDTQEYETEVIIAEGGHYKYALDWVYYEELEVELEISSSDNKNFDVYIMDNDQYENAYEQNDTIIAFSAYFSKENVTKVDEKVDLPARYFYYLVIDNKDTPLTPNDATPDGVITLDVYVKYTSTYYLD